MMDNTATDSRRSSAARGVYAVVRIEFKPYFQYQYVYKSRVFAFDLRKLLPRLRAPEAARSRTKAQQPFKLRKPKTFHATYS